MPMTKGYRKRKQMKKPMRRARRSIARKARMNNNDLHSAIIKTSGTIGPTQGLSVSNYIYTYWSTSPTLSAGQSNPLFNCPEFTLNRNMYDQFRVKGVGVRLVPRAKTQEANLLVQGGATVTQGRNVVYTVEDRDGIAPSSIASLKRYASVKTHSIFKTISRYYKVNYSKSNSWFDCQDPAGLLDVQRSLGLQGGITLYGESFPELAGEIINPVWYDIELTYYVTFKGKALVSVTVDEDGAVSVKKTFPVGEEPKTAWEHTSDQEHVGAVDTSDAMIIPAGATGTWRDA